MPKIITGPRGGQYYIDENGKKHYIKKSASSAGLAKQHSTNQTSGRSGDRIRSKEGSKESPTLVKHVVRVADYEHSGDLDHEIAYIKSICPEATNFRSWEEEDYEAEDEYEREYGECDEGIYQGFVEFWTPASCKEILLEYGYY